MVVTLAMANVIELLKGFVIFTHYHFLASISETFDDSLFLFEYRKRSVEIYFLGLPRVTSRPVEA